MFLRQCCCYAAVIPSNDGQIVAELITNNVDLLQYRRDNNNRMIYENGGVLFDKRRQFGECTRAKYYKWHQMNPLCGKFFMNNRPKCTLNSHAHIKELKGLINDSMILFFPLSRHSNILISDRWCSGFMQQRNACRDNFHKQTINCMWTLCIRLCVSLSPSLSLSFFFHLYLSWFLFSSNAGHILSTSTAYMRYAHCVNKANWIDHLYRWIDCVRIIIMWSLFASYWHPFWSYHGLSLIISNKQNKKNVCLSFIHSCSYYDFALILDGLYTYSSHQLAY